MDWWLQAQRFGFKLDPTEVQSVVYLYAKVRRWEGIWDLFGISDQVYTKPPWEYYSCTAFPGGEKYFCFTELKKMNQNQNRVVRTVGSYGTWHESSCKKIFGGNNYINKRIIGFKKLLNFKVKGEGTDWLMHEFSLPEKDTNLVLCVIQKTQKKKEKKEEMGSAYEAYLELYRGCRIEMVSFPDLFSTTSAGGDPAPAPAPAPSPAPAPAHDDHFALQVLDSEEQETPPSKKMRSDPVSVASSSDDLPLDYWNKFADRLREDVPDLSEDESALLELSGLRDDVFGLLDDVPGIESGLPDVDDVPVFGLPDDDFFDFATTSF